MKDKVITVQNLTKHFGNFKAVDDISFEIERGEIFGFLGANGAGKTTAMKMLCALSKPTSGKAMVAGFDISKEPNKIKANIGYMSQKFSLYEDLSIWENIKLFGGIYGMGRREIKITANALLQRLEMIEEKNTMVKSIPLGWKQKLAFSIAVFHHPQIVFLDEPTGGVDPITRRRFWEMICETAEEGITIFVTTHYMDEAEYCNRVSLMVDGQIAALDKPTNLKTCFGVQTMEEVFYQVARKAKRAEGL